MLFAEARERVGGSRPLSAEEMPRSPEEIEAEWLTAVLCARAVGRARDVGADRRGRLWDNYAAGPAAELQRCRDRRGPSDQGVRQVHDHACSAAHAWSGRVPLRRARVLHAGPSGARARGPDRVLRRGRSTFLALDRADRRRLRHPQSEFLAAVHSSYARPDRESVVERCRMARGPLGQRTAGWLAVAENACGADAPDRCSDRLSQPSTGRRRARQSG